MTLVAPRVAAGIYLAVRGLAPVIGPVLRGSGCSGRPPQRQCVLLDTQQASIASTIAGVAHQQSMPRAAVTIAYATAMQESKLHNLHYEKSVGRGVPAAALAGLGADFEKLEDPVYATSKFFRALESSAGTSRCPSTRPRRTCGAADGSAYIQYEKMATAMTTAFTGQRGRAVCCFVPASWSSPPSPQQADLTGVTGGLAHAFGTAVSSTATDQRGHSILVRIGHGRLGWEVTSWLVTHASNYGIHQVRFGGYQWRADAGSKAGSSDAGEPPARHY